jgi:hypothetical protein
MTEPTNTLLLKILTSSPVLQRPATVMGELLKLWPFRGVLMVAACVGGAVDIRPSRPTEPD